MTPMTCKRLLRSFALVTLLAVAAPALAQEGVANFYKGKTITIVVGTSAGGGYDTYSRLMARYMTKHIPGNPVVVVQNMPGAASNLAAGYVYGVAPRDGTFIVAPFPASIIETLISEKAQTRFDASKFNYLGSANSDVYVCLSRADSGIKTLDDAMTKEIIVGATADGGSTRDFPTLLNKVLGTKFNVVNGYAGTREITLALEKGEVQGQCGTGWSSISSLKPDWFRDGTVNIVVQEEATGYPELNAKGIKRTVDFAKTQEQRQMLELLYSQEIFGRPYMVGPEVPAERVEALRQAFMETWKDPELVAEAAKMKLDIGALSGADVQSVVTKVFATPPSVIAKVKSALAIMR
jgi:tripartite-type tricarboxylate transporter receptor subunit TctC